MFVNCKDSVAVGVVVAVGDVETVGVLMMDDSATVGALMLDAVVAVGDLRRWAY
jgi:hypothetical protein